MRRCPCLRGAVDRLDDAPRRDRRHQQLGAQAGSASLTALVMAAGGRDGAALADALLAEARVGRGRLHVDDADRPAPRSGPGSR